MTEPPLDEFGLILGGGGGGGNGDPESSKVDLEEELLEAFLSFLCFALFITITPLANFCSLDNLWERQGLYE